MPVGCLRSRLDSGMGVSKECFANVDLRGLCVPGFTETVKQFKLDCGSFAYIWFKLDSIPDFGKRNDQVAISDMSRSCILS